MGRASLESGFFQFLFLISRAFRMHERLSSRAKRAFFLGKTMEASRRVVAGELMNTSIGAAFGAGLTIARLIYVTPKPRCMPWSMKSQPGWDVLILPVPSEKLRVPPDGHALLLLVISEPTGINSHFKLHRSHFFEYSQILLTYNIKNQILMSRSIFFLV